MAEEGPGAYRCAVRPEWIDYNGHMNVAYYILAFDQATDHLLDWLGADAAYRAANEASTFCVEAHVTYRQEVAAGDPLAISTQLLSHDEKRLHYFQAMRHAEQGFLAATCEWLLLHVDMKARRVAPWPPDVAGRIEGLAAAQADLALPAEALKTIRPARKPVAALEAAVAASLAPAAETTA